MDNIRSQRNKEKFSHEGFLYIFDKKSADGNRKMWRCERKDYSCTARIHTDAIKIHSILYTYSSKYMVSVIFQYYGTEFAHNYEQR